MGKRSSRKLIKAAGGLVWRTGSEGRELAIIYRDRYGGEWGLPKGHLDKGETWEEAAVREVLEETGCVVESRTFAGTTDYIVDGSPKIVLFWHMNVRDEGTFKAGGEIQKLAWVSPKEALGMLKHEDERKLVKRAIGD